MDRFEFWRRWLLAVSLFLVVFGLALTLFNQTAVFDYFFNSRINPSFWPDGALDAETIDFQRWVYGVLGAMLSGWCLMMAFLAQFPFKQRERWAWNALTASLMLWYVIDTAVSLRFAPFNAAFNTLLLLLLGLPLLFTRRDFQVQA